MGQNRKC